MAQTSSVSEQPPFYRLRSVALIGASSRAEKAVRLFTDRFPKRGFQKLYPVNFRKNEILGVRAYPAATDTPGPVDLAIILTPPPAVIEAVKGCVAKGVKGIVINTAGFGEEGEEGKAQEQEMARIAREGGKSPGQACGLCGVPERLALD
jgi:acyl-CoA synthetase (NDP forming)